MVASSSPRGVWWSVRPRAAEVARFGILVGFTAIFLDAALAHGLFWENDPYWTYWITKTFLITTVFTIGTAFIGIGIWQGLALTFVHTLVLEIYYQWLSPIGLPQEPQWLSFQDLWLPGFITHYLVIFGGYTVALWMWRRHHGLAAASALLDPRVAAVSALVIGLLAILLDGVLTQWLLLQNFGGITFFVQRLLIAVVFAFAWSTFVGADLRAVTSGGVLLALIWTTYQMYLAPAGGPSDVALFTGRPPLSEIEYLGYEDLWFRSLPGGIVAAVIAWWIGARLLAAFLERLALAIPAVGDRP